MQSPSPFISVIIPTFNRAALLRSALESLAAQTMEKKQYEVVVVDDGSRDDTQTICHSFVSRMQMKYFRLNNSGIAAAKNLGVFASSGSVLLFFDDDDIADRNLLHEHSEFHRKNPEENVAALGYTTWLPCLHVNSVMHYVTEVAHFLFAYSLLTDGQVLDYTYFWGGRSSCKRSLLVHQGVFNQQFRFGSEDIELGYRLTKFGFKVIFHRKAVQYMNRPITFIEFCQRCEKQGVSQHMFSRLHPAEEVQRYCQVKDAEAQWATFQQDLDKTVNKIHQIEQLLMSGMETESSETVRGELWSLYKWTFNAFKIKGIVEQQIASNESHGRSLTVSGTT
jgi:cellulose synthase/poly-beta-1,6-N-acetylglucosamine synthase-like glycosyltransferase